MANSVRLARTTCTSWLKFSMGRFSSVADVHVTSTINEEYCKTSTGKNFFLQWELVPDSITFCDLIL